MGGGEREVVALELSRRAGRSDRIGMKKTAMVPARLASSRARSRGKEFIRAVEKEPRSCSVQSTNRWEPGATKVQGSLLKLFAEPVANFSSIHSYDSFGAEGLFEEKCLEGVSAMKRRCTMGLVFLLIGVHPFSLMAMPNPDTGPGCGLGKNLWEGWKGQKQIAPQVFMSSTNVTGSYSFAISSGTSGCSHDGRIWDSERANLFIGINYASLSEDMARGAANTSRRWQLHARAVGTTTRILRDGPKALCVLSSLWRR